MPTKLNPTSYAILLRDKSFTDKYILSDYVSLEFSVEINRPGAAKLVVGDANPFVDEVSSKDMIVISRTPRFRQITQNPRNVWSGFLIEHRVILDGNSRRFHEFTFAGGLAALQNAIVAWTANTTDRSTFSSTEVQDIIYEVVRQNLTNLATTGLGRERTFDHAAVKVSMSAPSSPASPTSIDYSCAWRNVYDVVIELCEAHGYEVRMNVDNESAFLVTLDYDGFGSDRTDEILLRYEDGRIGEFSSKALSQTEKTVALVGGMGQESNRTIQIETGDTYSSSTNSTEIYVDARNSPDSQLTQIGDARLRAQLENREYTIRMLDNPGLMFHITGTNPGDFWVGDTILFDNGSSVVNAKITKAGFRHDTGEEEIVTMTLEEQ